jgi:hypothetical protein
LVDHDPAAGTAAATRRVDLYVADQWITGGAPLKLGVQPSALERPLVLRSRAQHRFTSPDRPTVTLAVDLPVIAVPADEDFPVAARAAEIPALVLDHQDPGRGLFWTRER